MKTKIFQYELNFVTQGFQKKLARQLYLTRITNQKKHQREVVFFKILYKVLDQFFHQVQDQDFELHEFQNEDDRL